MAEKYKELPIDFPLTEELAFAIKDMLHHINYEDGMVEDWKRMEVDFWLKDALTRSLTREQYQILKDYYVLGDIYAQCGNPIQNRESK